MQKKMLSGAHCFAIDRSKLVNPFHSFAKFNGDDSNNCLEHDKKNVQISFDQMIIAGCQTLVDKDHRHAAEAVHGTSERIFPLVAAFKDSHENVDDWLHSEELESSEFAVLMEVPNSISLKVMELFKFRDDPSSL
eukprot:CAMPEP_0176005876 /NCGR_PEP_ID=MMETSP0120_2-20121206/2432_1 /TAXON_ID=160619 /ORGANISM="Kryptoperidinium foliaceum, Strain CCMP 1326" /LENGTH=134 /DNA_ID=CAMNT_0017338597 /DNA_START=384 /DNA_END=789 /DNA_ORIENTATION=-